MPSTGSYYRSVHTQLLLCHLTCLNHRLRYVLNQLTEIYPIDQIPQPIIRNMFGCSLYPTFNDQGLTFSPFLGDEIQLSEDEVPSFSITLPGSLTDAVDESLSPSVLFCAFRTEGLFVRRESYLTETGRSSLVLASNVACARLSLGVIVSDLTEPVRITFMKDDAVSYSVNLYDVYCVIVESLFKVCVLCGFY